MIERRAFLWSSATAVLAAAVDTPVLARAVRGGARPPVAPVRPVIDTYFGTRVVDDYRWMERPGSKEFGAWLAGQNRFARAGLDALPGRARWGELYDRYVNQSSDGILLAVRGDRAFIVRMDPAHRAGRVFLVAPGVDRLLFDVKDNGNPAMADRNIDWRQISPDGSQFAYGLSRGGSEDSAAYVMDVATGKTTQLTTRRTRGTGWTADGTGLFTYRTRADRSPKDPDYRIGGAAHYHRLGSDPSTDRIVFRAGEGDRFDPQSSDEPYVAGAAGSRWLVGVHMLNDSLPNQIYVAPEADVLAGRARWRRIVGPEAKAEAWWLDGDRVLVLARGRMGAGEVVAIDAASGTFENANIVFAGKPGLLLKNFGLTADGYWATREAPERDELLFVDRAGRSVPVKAAPGTRLAGLVTDPRGRSLFVETFDELHPYLNHRYEGPTASPVAAPLYASPFDPSRYRKLSVEVTARDGTKVPLDLLMLAGAKPSPSNRIMIDAYGAYGIGDRHEFSPETIAMIEGGVMVAAAHVRGGGAKGEDWHVAGMKATKPNTWRDAIDIGRWLIKEGWTSPAHLSIMGTSAGGIMVGRAITEAPELFGAAVGNVGIFDALRMETTANGPGNVSEFGTVRNPDEFRALLAMDSIQAVRNGTRYPRVLLTTGLNDSRVDPWLPGKFAARLQRASADPARIWLSVDSDGGHGAASLAGRRRAFVDRMSFLQAFS